MTRWVAVAALAALASCGRNAHAPGNGMTNETSAATANEASGSQTAPGTNEAANQAAAASPQGSGAALPPANAEFRFVGHWATTTANCAAHPWIFTAKTLKVTNGPECNFYRVSKAPGGYDIAARCPTKKPVETDLIKLRFAESAGAMLVESNAISPTGLVYCGVQSKGS